jgi:hypothetical protein
MSQKKGTTHARGWKLNLSSAERERRSAQLKVNGKPAFKITKAQADNVIELLKTNTAVKVSELTGISKPTISRIKNGKHVSEIPQ